MPKNKSHRGLLKRIKLTKSGKVRFKAPNSRHLKSNKRGEEVQSYRKSRYAASGDLRFLKKLLHRGLRSEERSIADAEAREAAAAGAGATTAGATTAGATTAKAKPAAKSKPAAGAKPAASASAAKAPAAAKPAKPAAKPAAKK